MAYRRAAVGLTFNTSLPANVASTHVMEKLGMMFEKHARYYDLDVVQYCTHCDEFKWDDSQQYGLFPEEVT